jgi:hypothetical protein
MKKSRRSNISIETLTIAALALLALAILGFIFKTYATRSGQQFGDIADNVQDELEGNVDECPQFGLLMRCFDKQCPDEGWQQTSSYKCSKNGQVCCQRV